MSAEPAARPLRMRPDDRRAEILAVARQLLLESGYAAVGPAEIAAAGGISRPSVYRYFPDGRAEVFASVVETIGDELRERLRYAAGAPFSVPRRLEQVLAAVFAFFRDSPGSYRILFRDAWAVGEPEAEAAAGAVRSLLVGDLAGLLVEGGVTDAETATASANAILGAALASVGRTIDGGADAERAWRVTCDLALAALPPG